MAPDGNSAALTLLLRGTLLALSLLLASCGATQRQHRATSHIVPRPAFAVFDGAPSAADAVTPEVAATLSRSIKPEFDNAEIEDARRVLADDPGWLLPAANGEICLVQLIYPVANADHVEALPALPVISCEPQARAQAGELVATHSLSSSVTEAAKIQVVGIVPDGVRTVKIISHAERAPTVDVVRNAYEAVVPDPVSIRFVTATDHKQITHVIALVSYSGAALRMEGDGGP